MAWDFRRPIESLALARDLASFVATLDLDDWRNVLRTGRQDLPQSLDAWSFRDSTEDAPRVMMFDDNPGQVILIQGVKRESTALRLMQAYGERFDLEQPAGLNAQVKRAMVELDNAFFSVSGSLRDSVILAGHSFGGAVAQAWGAFLKRHAPAKTVRVITFGSPRVGIRQWQDENGTLNHVRYWNDGDPVPLIAPRTSEAVAAHAVIHRQASYRWNQFGNQGRGVRLSVTGKADAEAKGVQPAPLTEVNVIGWATGLLQRPVQAHSIQEYYLRLDRAADANVSWHTGPPAQTIRARRGDPEPPPPSPQDVPVVAAQIAVVSAAVVAVRSAPIPTDYSFRQVGGEWGVFRGVEFVTFCASRARAQRIARTANTLLQQARTRGVENDADVARVVAGML